MWDVESQYAFQPYLEDLSTSYMLKTSSSQACSTFKPIYDNSLDISYASSLIKLRCLSKILCRTIGQTDCCRGSFRSHCHYKCSLIKWLFTLGKHGLGAYQSRVGVAARKVWKRGGSAPTQPVQSRSSNTGKRGKGLKDSIRTFVMNVCISIAFILFRSMFEWFWLPGFDCCKLLPCRGLFGDLGLLGGILRVGACRCIISSLKRVFKGLKQVCRLCSSSVKVFSKSVAEMIISDQWDTGVAKGPHFSNQICLATPHSFASSLESSMPNWAPASKRCRTH